MKIISKEVEGNHEICIQFHLLRIKHTLSFTFESLVHIHIYLDNYLRKALKMCCISKFLLNDCFHADSALLNIVKRFGGKFSDINIIKMLSVTSSWPENLRVVLLFCQSPKLCTPWLSDKEPIPAADSDCIWLHARSM